MLKKKTKSKSFSLLDLRRHLAVLLLSLLAGANAGQGAVALLRPGWILPVGAGSVLCLFSFSTAHAAAKVVERVADGQVVTKADDPISGAVVFLKDAHTQAIRTYICDQTGHFHFGQLAQNTDYEIWAESNGVRSHSKSISSFDSKNGYNFTLKINESK